MLTTGRSDYGLLYWTIRGIHEDSDLDLSLLVTGAHLSTEFGLTVRDVEADGFPIAARVEMLLSSDTGEAVATGIGLGTIKMTQALANLKPDILVLLGDRTELLAAVTAALPQLIPVAHLHGGESTEGVIDECIRHALTKLSHLHFVANDFYARRLIQMGEEEWRVHVSGAPGLEHLYRTALPSKEEVERELGLDLSQPTLLATYHPVTLYPDRVSSDSESFLAAIEHCGLPAVVTYPNQDSGGRTIIDRIQVLAERSSRIRVLTSLGARLYLGLLRYAAVMVGNSSSGIIEAASFGLPVVNVGERQRGRLRPANVIDVPSETEAILHGIERALAPDFRGTIAGLPNPYDRGKASEIILRVLKGVDLGQGLLQKRLVDLPATLEGLADRERV